MNETQSKASFDVGAGGQPVAKNLERWSARDMVDGVRIGTVKADDLSSDQRQACVEYLTEEGHTNREIAQLIEVHERTIRRDRRALRKSLAVKPDPGLGDEWVGELERLTSEAVQRLTKLARDPATPPSVRLSAEEAATRTYQRFVETARRMGYAETGSKRLREEQINSKTRMQEIREQAREFQMEALKSLTAPGGSAIFSQG